MTEIITSNNEREERYPIRTVSSLTGIQTVTLRAWERRYKLIQPIRTTTGHRLYSREDVEKIRKAAGLLEKGINISHAVQILNNPDFSDPANSDLSATWILFQQQILDATSCFDEKKLEEIYQRALSVYPIATVIRKLIIPVLEALGNKWDKTTSGIACEHFFSVFLRNKLGARFHHRSHNNTGPKLICACLPGEHHEVGLLLFSLAADEANYRQILLGADMPIPHLAEAAIKSSAEAIILSGKCTTDLSLITRLIKNLIASTIIPVFIGGDVSINFESEMKSAGAIFLGNDIQNGILILNEKLKTRPAKIRYGN
ncbi:MAG: MerR family transcriptional regulator [Gammaproteobacteria bacterium]|nr:MerR family transcriptional regulator [Gammaproteobacteria bacterium]